MNAKFFPATLCIAALLPLPTMAAADCVFINKVAGEAYTRANAALGKKWNDSARTSASLFWYVHGLEECPLTEIMATHMTQAGLGKGTEPTGETSTGPQISIPPGTAFVPTRITNVTGAVAPETVIVNGVYYRKSFKEAAPASIDSKLIEKYLKDDSKLDLKGFQADRKYLEQWKPLILDKSQK